MSLKFLHEVLKRVVQFVEKNEEKSFKFSMTTYLPICYGFEFILMLNNKNLKPTYIKDLSTIMV